LPAEPERRVFITPADSVELEEQAGVDDLPEHDGSSPSLQRGQGVVIEHATEPRDAVAFELGERALDIDLLGAGDQHGLSRDP
jgi:hypothetical protein